MKQRQNISLPQPGRVDQYELSQTDPRDALPRLHRALQSVINCRPILSVFSALIVHSELKSVHPGFPVAFIF